MAKIESVQLEDIPEEIIIGDDINDINVEVTIKFHALDVALNMEYLLHLFVYDIKGKLDVPVIISNWDDTKVFTINQDGRNDDFLGTESVAVKAQEDTITIDVAMALKLGSLPENHRTYLKRKLEVYAAIIPAIGIASKWSNPFETRVSY
ncbi:hypothetical protein IMCC3317_11430 [Kordia antarctica]|uniref:Uncharacterized protein n=1 Tax=Kordia antarctica TaxID=1218801 RepID=A0A7L4ZGM6_9FLAO|nr:hypothetical protein [Kordia antarctica]QHI35795.1 hypothetical protein IMCC3317_11430 [Kordia antarctica]